MTAPRGPVWPIEPHTRAKHELLRHYLGAWYPVMASRERRVVFIDGFAGPGIYEAGEPGSPVIALRTLLEHQAFSRLAGCEFVFHFIEAEEPRLKRLRAELDKFGALPSNVTVASHLGEFEQLARTLTSELGPTRLAGVPTLAFIDPFGVSGVSMDLVKEIVGSRKCELMLTLMVDTLNRFLDTPRILPHGERLFGTTDFSRVSEAPRGMRVSELVGLYEEQLRRVAGFRHTHHFKMLRSDNSIAYYIVYATKSSTGVEKFKAAMWKVDPSTGGRFSDRDYKQGSLLTGEFVERGRLKLDLLSAFRGKDATIAELEAFVIPKVFLVSHLKKALREMEKSGQLEATRPGGGTRGYPKGTQVRFNNTLGI